MPTVKIGRSRQVTIPKKLFEMLALKEGDYVDVEIKGHQIVLTPKALIDRAEAKAQLFDLIDRIRERNKDLEPAEVEDRIAKALEEVRSQKSASR